MSIQQKPDDYLFNLDFRKYADILIRQKRFVLVFCISAIISSLAFTYFFSEKYEAAITIYYRPQETSLFRHKEAESFGAPVPAPPFKVISQTLQNIIKSEVVLRPVVEILHLDRKVETKYDAWYERWYHKAKDFLRENGSKLWMILKYGRIIEEDDVVKAIKGLAENIDITTTKDSYVYLLKVKDKYPERAASIADTAGQFLVEWLKQQDQNPAEKKRIEFQKQLSEKENELKLLRDERAKMLQKNRIVSVSEETSTGVKSLYAMEQERDELIAQIEEKQHKIAELDKQVQKKFKGYINPDDMKKVESEKLFEEVELKGLIARNKSLQSSIKDLKTKLQQMVPLEKKLENLNTQIDSATREYTHLDDLYLEAFTQTATAESEIRVLHPATVPAKPVQPIKIYHVGLTTLLGLFFSMGLVYFLAFFNVRIFFVSKGVQGRTLEMPEEKIIETKEEVTLDKREMWGKQRVSIETKKSLNRKLSRVYLGVIILAVLGIVVFLFKGSGHESLNSFLKGTSEQGELVGKNKIAEKILIDDKNIKKDISSSSVDESKMVISHPEITSKNEADQSVLTKPKTLKKTIYSVHAGAFLSEKNAVPLADKLRQKGYDAFLKKVLRNDQKTVYRVLVGRFDNQNKALEQSQIIHQKEGLESFVYHY